MWTVDHVRARIGSKRPMAVHIELEDVRLASRRTSAATLRMMDRMSA